MRLCDWLHPSFQKMCRRPKRVAKSSGMRALLVQHPFERCESAECKMHRMLRVCRSKLHADLETISFESKCRRGRR